MTVLERIKGITAFYKRILKQLELYPTFVPSFHRAMKMGQNHRGHAVPVIFVYLHGLGTVGLRGDGSQVS